MPNILTRTNAMGSSEEKARDLVKERLRRSADRVQGHIRQLRKFWRYYLSLTDRYMRREPDRDTGSQTDWRADLFIPAIFSIVETAIPRIVFALFGQRPYVQVVGRERGDLERIKAVEAMMDYDFEQARLVLKSLEFFKSFYIFGTAVGRVDYFKDTYTIDHPKTYSLEMDIDDAGEIVGAKAVQQPTEEIVTRFDGPRFSVVSLDNFFPDPMFYEIDEMRYVVEREETTKDKLEADDEKYRAVMGKSLYRNLDDIKPYKEGAVTDFNAAEDFRQDSADAFNLSFGYSGSRSRDMRDEDSVILYRYWEDDRYIVIANGHTILRDSENPFNDKRKPYVACQCFPTLKEFYGQGLVAPVQYLQEELNTLENMALDQGKFNIYGIWAVDESLTLSDADQAVYPGKTIKVEFENGRPNIQQVFQSQLSSDFERLSNRIERQIQSGLGINDYMVGAGPGSAGTASEAAMLNASAANRFRLQALHAQERFLVELCNKFLSRRQQFLDKRRVFRVLGEQGYEYPEMGPEDIAGQFDFVPLGSQVQPNKEVLRAQMGQNIALAGGNPILLAMTNWPEVYKEAWSLMDFRFPQRFILPPPAKQLSQKQENFILLNGENVAVDPNENHEQHLQELMQILDQATEMAQAGDDRPLRAVEEHANQHSKYVQESSAKTPMGGQTPGQISGAPGNQPNQTRQQVPTLPSMMARVQGGPGGPVA